MALLYHGAAVQQSATELSITEIASRTQTSVVDQISSDGWMLKKF